MMDTRTSTRVDREARGFVADILGKHDAATALARARCLQHEYPPRRGNSRPRIPLWLTRAIELLEEAARSGNPVPTGASERAAPCNNNLISPKLAAVQARKYEALRLQLVEAARDQTIPETARTALARAHINLGAAVGAFSRRAYGGE